MTFNQVFIRLNKIHNKHCITEKEIMNNIYIILLCIREAEEPAHDFKIQLIFDVIPNQIYDSHFQEIFSTTTYIQPFYNHRINQWTGKSIVGGKVFAYHKSKSQILYD